MRPITLEWGTDGQQWPTYRLQLSKRESTRHDDDSRAIVLVANAESAVVVETGAVGRSGTASATEFAAVRKTSGYDPPYRVPGYPIVPALFILSALYVLVNALVDPRGRWATVAIFGVTLPGVPAYHLSVGKSVCSGGQGSLRNGVHCKLDWQSGDSH